MPPGQRLRCRTEMKIFGVQDWPGRKSFDFFQQSADGRVSEVWLAHGSVSDRTGRHPATLTASHEDDLDEWGIDLEESILIGAAVRIMSMSLPRPEVERPPGLHRRLRECADEAVAGRAQWPRTTISVDGQQADCLHWTFAHWTLGFCAPLPEFPMVLVVNSPGIRPGLRVQSLSDTTEYGVDLREGFDVSDTSPLEIDEPDDFHSDYTRLPQS